jgi:hypothetical protein
MPWCQPIPPVPGEEGDGEEERAGDEEPDPAMASGGTVSIASRMARKVDPQIR